MPNGLLTGFPQLLHNFCTIGQKKKEEENDMNYWKIILEILLFIIQRILDTLQKGNIEEAKTDLKILTIMVERWQTDYQRTGKAPEDPDPRKK